MLTATVPTDERATEGPTTILAADDLHLSFGGIQALAGVSFAVSRGEIFSVIGPNGAGKTSVLNLISGVYRPTRGRILFEGRELGQRGTQAVAALGIARTFQNIALFKGMSVIENILVGRHHHMRAGVLACGIHWGPGAREERVNRAAVERIVDFLGIGHIRDTAAETLPYGLQKRVELGRALAVEPKLLLLDEPMAGMNHEEKREMIGFFLDVNARFGTTMILIEHDMGVVMDVSDRVLVLDHGVTIAEGTPDAVRGDPKVIRAYLGDEA